MAGVPWPACSLCKSAQGCSLQAQQGRNALLRSRSRLQKPYVPSAQAPCFRMLEDNFISVEQCSRAANAVKSILAYESGSERHFPLHMSAVEAIAPPADAALLNVLIDQVTHRVRRVSPHATLAGGLANWILGAGATEQTAEAETGTFAPHVDKANQGRYDISALLYLTRAGVDHDGGHFSFNDIDADRVVKPIPGRLLTFCSGFQNVHQVRPVFHGDRIVLSMWYSHPSLDQV